MSDKATNANEAWTPPDKIWNPMFFSIFFINLALNFGQQMSNALLPVYAKSTGAPAGQIGILSSMFAITALVFRFVAGPAMNAFTRKKLVAGAMGVMAIAYLGFALSPYIAPLLGVETIKVMMAFRLFQGIGNAFGNGCCLAIVADTLPRHLFSTGMAYYATAQVIAQAISPTIGVFLRDHLPGSYTSVYILFSVLMTVSAIMAFTMKAAPQAKVPFKMNLNNMIARECLIPAVVAFLVGLGFTSINAFMLIYSEERGISGGSLFFTVYAVTMLVTRPAVGKMTEKYGFVRIGIPCILMTALSLQMIGISGTLLMLLTAAFINSFGYGAVQPMMQSLCMKAVGSERRGSATSTYYIFFDLATIIGPSVCGMVADTMGYVPTMWTVMAVPVVLAAVFVFITRKPITQIETDFAAGTAVPAEGEE